MIEYSNKSIFDVQANVITIPVNCVGVMGAGLALEFKKRRPIVFAIYNDYCKLGMIKPGRPVYISHPIFGDEYDGYLMFPTKNHWKDSSKLEYITSGLEYIRNNIMEMMFDTIPCWMAFPKLGCGYGGLNYNAVRPIMVEYLSQINCIGSIICE